MIVEAAKAINPLRQVDKESRKLRQSMTRTQRAMRNLGVVGARATRKLKDGFDRAAKGAKALASKLGGLRGAFLSLGAGALAKSLIGQAASFQETQVRLEQLSKEYGEFAEVQKLVRQNAKTFNQSLAESGSNFADVFARLRPLGISLDKIQTTYEGFNAVALASGTSAAAASGAFLQLSQALGSGRLQGDEFRSVSEQVPGILRLVAKEMNVTVGQLKNLGSEGKITSDILINALAKGFEENKDKIQDLIAQSPAQQFKAFNNAVSGLSNAIGTELLPVVVPMVKELTKAVQAFGDLPGPVKTFTAAVIGIAGAAAIAIPPLASLIGLIGAPALIAAAPFVAAAAGLGALTVAAIQGTQKVMRFNEIVNITGNTIEELDKETEEVNKEIKSLQANLDRGGRRAAVARKKVKQLEEALEKIEGRREIVIAIKTDVPFPNFDQMGPGFREELDRLLGKTPPLTDEQKRLRQQTADQGKAASERLRISSAELKIMGEQSATDKIRLQFALKKANTEAKYADLLSKALSDQERSNLQAAQRNDLEIIRLEKNEAITQALQDQFQMYDDLDTSVLTFTGHTEVLSEEFKSIADTINNEIINGIQGMIEGTKTLGDVASSILKRLASQYLEMAIMGKQGSSGIVGSIFSALGFGSNPLSGFSGGGLKSGLDSKGLFNTDLGLPEFGSIPSGFKFANGGRPPVGKASLVGERGPELFVPDRAGTIVPNHAMGGANVTVNVDASGSSVEGNADQASQLGKAIGIAVQQELVKQKRPGGLLAS